MDYQSSQSAWPMQASESGVTFEFSATFDAGRVAAERLARAGQKSLRFFLTMACAGEVAIALTSFYFHFSDDGALFLFTHHWVNLVFWVVLPAVIYRVALAVDDHLQSKASRISRSSLQVWQKLGKPIDVHNLFTPDAREVWQNIALKQKELGLPTVSLSLVFLTLLDSESIQRILTRLGIIAADLQELVKTAAQSSLAAGEQELVLKLPFEALAEGLRLHDNAVDPFMLLCALHKLLPEEHPLAKMFFSLDVDREKLEALAIWMFNIRIVAEEQANVSKLARFKPDNEIDKGLTAVPTPYLDQFSSDLTMAAKYGRLPVALGREADLDRALGMLSDAQQNILILGELGSGRSALISELAYRMVTEDVPPALQDKRLVKFDLSNVVGSRLPPETVLAEALAEAEKSGNIVLVLEDVHALGKATGERGLSLLEVLVNRLADSPLIAFGTSTPGDYQDYLKPTLNFDQQFSKLELGALPRASTILACCIRASFLEAKHGVFFMFDAILAAIDLSDQYIKDVAQPQKAIQLLTNVATEAGKKSSDTERIITKDTIQKQVAELTHVPEDTFTQVEAQKLLSLESDLAKFIIGQKQAVRAVVEALQRARSGLTKKTRPIASFLFVGPTGVGKTELAKTLARVYFGSESYFLRLDMSEYQGADGIERLLGDPDDQTLTVFVKHLKTYPFCLFLLDEFEKASREVLNLFLQVFEDGRLTTAKGETLDLTNTIIIATSNAGTPEIQAGIKVGEDIESIRKRLFDSILTQHFAPELLNRFDGTILFTPLTQSEVEQITTLALNSLSKQLLDTKGLTFDVAPEALSYIAKSAYDPSFGARPIRRFIQDNVETLLAKSLLAATPPRGTTMHLTMQNGQLILS